VIFLTDVGEVEVAQIVVLIKGQEKSAVADGNVTGHWITY
jgi:hypothetical protein